MNIRVYLRTLVLCGLTFSLMGCLSVTRPTIAHTHLGHTTEGWVDTPGQIGLIDVAEKEAENAADHAAKAFASAGNIAEMKKQVSAVKYALDPKSGGQGDASGYGFIRSFTGAVNHVEYASQSDDASENIRASILDLSASASRVQRGAKVALGICTEMEATSNAEELKGLAEELKSQTDSNLRATRAWNKQLSDVLAREKPPYTPVEKRYLFGLIRLPSGLWQWHPKLDSDEKIEFEPYDG